MCHCNSLNISADGVSSALSRISLAACISSLLSDQVILASLTPDGATVNEIIVESFLVVCGWYYFSIFLSRDNLKRSVFLTLVIYSFQIRELSV